MRAVLGLCLSLVLAGCSGGLLPTPGQGLPPTPARTAAPGFSATVAATEATAAAGPSASSSPDPGVAKALESAPEIVGGVLSPADRERYVRLVAALRTRDATAADWLASTGLFLRDGRLDDQEVQTLEMLLRTKGQPLWYVMHARTLDGITPQDFDYFKATVATPTDNWYLEDDIRGLQEFQLLSQEGQRSLQRIFARARDDPEIQKGLYLINALGPPDTRAFKYPVPSFNTQLYLLARLLEQGVPGEYERAATAAALVYGSLVTLSDQEARLAVVDYAAERVRFLIDTDVLLAAAGVHWRSTDYPLEALMAVLWGGQAAAYPDPQQPLAKAPPLIEATSQRPLTRKDLDRLLVRVDNLRQMQDEMMPVAIEQTRDEAAAAELIEQWWSTDRRDDPDQGGPDLNQQWGRFRAGHGFAGGAEAAYVLQGLAASINLPLPWAQLWYGQNGQLQVVPYGLRLDPKSRTLQLGNSALRATAKLPAEAKAVLVWWRVPWDNWHLSIEVRSCQTEPLPFSVWRNGIPSGYLIRQGSIKEEEALSALGVAAGGPPGS